ncbi:MAG: zinc-ribbon domain-containing protein, partial [Polyangiaceae bacterium]
MAGCPKCGAPVADEDLACRQCGQSFIGDSNAVHEALMANPPPPAYANRPAPPAFVRAPVPFGGGMLPNPYARPEPLPGSPGGP